MTKDRLAFHWFVGAILAIVWWPQTVVGFFCMGFYFGYVVACTVYARREGK